MMRILILVALAAAVYLLIRQFSRKQPYHPSNPSSPPSRETVQCAQCHIYIPKDEAVNAEGQFFCCPQHARDWKQHH
jgi:uncharacterized protein